MSEWATATIEANGISIHYHRSGGADLPALLLLHGITDNGLCWSAVARDLQQHYDIIMPDARGHGRSSRLAGRLTVDLLADDVAALIGALGLERPYIWGHSMGATTALAAAASHPELVRAIVLEDPPLLAVEATRSTPEAARAIGRQHRENLVRLQALRREERFALALSQNPGWSEAENIPWADSKAEADPGVTQHIDTLRGYPWRQTLPSVRCPVLLVTGDPEAHALVTPQVAEEAAGLWRQGEIVRIAGAGHCIHRDRYDETLQVVRRFLSSH